MKLAVVVVNWNSRDDLAACLRSLAAQTHRALDVVVVDNGSTDGSAELVRQDFPAVRLVETGENLGFAEGSNRGIAATDTAWVAMLNNDAVAEPGWAEALVDAALAAEPRCGMLQSVLLFQKDPPEINSTGLEILPNGTGKDREFGAPWRTPRDAEEDIFCPTAGACLYRRAMLDEVRLPTGWFDRGHFLYSEDADLGWRARLAGWSAKLVPRSIVRHKFHGSSVRHDAGWLAALMHTNRMRTLVKNASPRFLVRTLPKTLEHLATISYHAGPRGLLRWGEAVRDAARLRPLVTRMSRVERAELEARWMRRAGA